MGLIERFLDRILYSLFLSAVLSLSITVWAENSGVNMDVGQLLQNPEQLTEFIKSNPEALKALGEHVKPEAAARMISQAFNQSKSSIDPRMVEKMMEDAKKDPQGFFNKLNPEQKKIIESMGFATEKSKD